MERRCQLHMCAFGKGYEVAEVYDLVVAPDKNREDQAAHEAEVHGSMVVGHKE